MKFYSFEIRLVDIYQRGALGKETFPVFWQRTNISWAAGIIQLIKVSINTFFVNKVRNALVSPALPHCPSKHDRVLCCHRNCPHGAPAIIWF